MARDGQPNRDRGVANRYRVYTPQTATRRLIDKGFPPARAAAIVGRYLADLAVARDGRPAGGWELRD